MRRTYRIAGHLLAVEAPENDFALLPNYAPFETEQAGTPLLVMHLSHDPLPGSDGWEWFFTDSSDDDLPRMEMYRRGEEWLFRVAASKRGEVVSVMRCRADWRELTLCCLPAYTRFAVDNAAMLLYAFAAAPLRTLLFHSSVTVLDGRAYMFLGRSGTGKSTHSEQWQAAFPQAWLLNDDNPVLRLLDDGSVRVYGSPWSGKTPCYRDENAPVQALVQLAQAPHNHIALLRMSQAYPHVLASVNGLKMLPEMMDRLYLSIAGLLETTPVYLLECQPTPDAARLCAQTCSLSPGRTDN